MIINTARKELTVRYEQGTKDVRDQMASIMKAYHLDLHKNKVKVGMLYAFGNPESESGRPLKVAGHPVDGVIRIVPERDRVAGMADAQMILDGDAMKEWSSRQLDALLDHELTHLVVKFDAEGDVRLDDAHRPKLGIKAHDWRVSGFIEIVNRHGVDSPEYCQVEALRDEYSSGQLRLFGDTPKALPEGK